MYNVHARVYLYVHVFSLSLSHEDSCDLLFVHGVYRRAIWRLAMKAEKMPIKLLSILRTNVFTSLLPLRSHYFLPMRAYVFAIGFQYPFIALLLLPLLIAFEFPALSWTVPLGEGSNQSRGFRRGNGLSISKDGRELWAVTDDGFLFILNGFSGELLYDINPLSISTDGNDDKEVIFTESRSSVSLHEVQSSNGSFGVVYGVYVLNEIYSDGDHRSKVIAANSQGDILWSNYVSGLVEGTPIIGNSGDYIYCNINRARSENVQNPTFQGAFIVMSASTGDIAGEINASDGYAFSPLQIHRQDDLGTLDAIDTLYWADSTKWGYATSGIIYKVFVDYQNEESLNIDARQQQLIEYTSMISPTISSNGEWILISGTNATIVTANTNSDGSLGFRTQLDQSAYNETMPLMSRAIFSSDRQKIFAASSSSTVFCLDSSDGSVEWIQQFDDVLESYKSVLFSKPILSEDSSAIYFMSHRKGSLTTLDPADGSLLWNQNCENLGEGDNNLFCEDSVEIDLVLSSDDSTIYYGNIFGEIHSVQVAPRAPTAMPIEQPMASESMLPSVPLVVPTIDPITFVPSKSPLPAPISSPGTNPIYVVNSPHVPVSRSLQRNKISSFSRYLIQYSFIYFLALSFT